ncbi:MAG: hypothetical protein KC468_16940, partial [Myxococcales bacterium]|nr:hypothetical protein [Myxococcales bacterium]
ATAATDAVGARLGAVPGVSDLAVAADGDARTTVSLTLTGAIDPLVRALAEDRIDDLVAGEPDLEQAVLGYYGRGGTR